MEEFPLKFSLLVVDPGLTETRLDTLTREMTRALNRGRGLQAHLAEGVAQPGAKGDPLAVGTIALQLLGSGGAVAVLLNGLKSYFLRKESLVIDVKRADGTAFSLHAENLSEQRMNQTADKLLEFLKA